jgi:hypothetical protein
LAAVFGLFRVSVSVSKSREWGKLKVLWNLILSQ